ncbi:hypothetical protein [Clostridium sp.]|uniref:hypothetical protein n=1 Tax=Clostridium sp. TaxID=1506 RepID=UPI003216CFDA
MKKKLFGPEKASPPVLRKLEGVYLLTFYRNEVKLYGISYKNHEGYADPTAYQALTQIENETRNKQVFSKENTKTLRVLNVSRDKQLI